MVTSQMDGSSEESASTVSVQRHVAAVGDWHGDTVWAKNVIYRLHKKGVRVVFHLGDFGVWPGDAGAKFLRKVDKWLTQYEMTMLVTPGNHEDWARLNMKQAKDRGDGWGPVKWLGNSIAVLPRGHRFTLTTPTGTTRTVVSLGGAPSVNFDYLTEGRDWWPEEAITQEDVTLVKAGGFADIMLAHDSPGAPYASAQVQRILMTNPFGFSEAGRAYAAEGTALMTEAFKAVQPRVFLHGHFHTIGTNEWSDPATGRSGVVTGTSEEWSDGNVVVVDLDTMMVVGSPRADSTPC